MHNQSPVSVETNRSVTSRLTDSPVEVTLPSGELASWKISQNLTDRWGDLNAFMSPNEAYQLLAADGALFESLQAQMCEETTFIVRKEGQFGILYELEFCTQHSEVAVIGEDDPDLQSRLQEYMTEEESKARLQTAIAELAPKFPGVEFCLPPREEMIEERLGMWAFVPNGHLNDVQSQVLAEAMYEYY
ncbi:hypothetical protein [Pseudomonas sp. GOM6]|uniref:hypothetical protein n=1 Tax=Pseudomonas sp. GOM6 TaxID=3036944 RepID=UPI0024095CB3|nr:hypothetical protein [Pseudomonas sp. GOM6]MDG1580892.1 hypothetical protein [Pseudomonas sp. GOM6]